MELEPFFECELSLLIIIINFEGCFFSKACYNVNFKCAKLLHRKFNNFNTTWM